jgi:hypothetical protein
VVGTIDWQAYTQTIQRFRSQRTQITKLCHNLLPTARWAHRYESLTTKHCLHCGEVEDHNHIITCSFGLQKTWRTGLLSKLRKAQSSAASDHFLINILINGLHAWFKGTTLRPDRYPRQYYKLIAEQTAIGWRHLFNGHLSTQWRIKQDSFLRSQKIATLTHPGNAWSRRTLTILWTKFLLLWQTRNKEIHGHDIASQRQAKHRKLHLEMEQLHTLRPQVLAGNTDVFICETPADLTHFLDTATATYVQNWLHIWKHFVISSAKSAKDLSLQGVSSITAYFIPTGELPHRPIAARAHRTARLREGPPGREAKRDISCAQIFSPISQNTKTVLK